MNKEILINSSSHEVRIAITEDGKLVELFYESPDFTRNVGDLYLGKIARILPGIRAAFINIGFQQDAFLHFSDIDTSIDDYSAILGDDEDVEDSDEDEDESEDLATQQITSQNRNSSALVPANLEKGQNIIVQIMKEPVPGKGVRVTSRVTIPGRYLVLMPFNRKIGVSKKIYNFRERRRLRAIVKSILPSGMGVIIRTVAAGQDEHLIREDLKKLLEIWSEIQTKIKTLKPPALLYKDASTTNSVIRDLFRDDVTRIIVDSKKLYKQIKSYVDETSPEFSNKIEYYSDSVPLFDAYNIEKQIEESLGKKVWLKNSGYIVIEPTEAMTVIDVNSGKYARSKEQEINSLKINFDAAREIARQARLRDIGGIIVIDFIDLYDEANKRKLYEELKKEFRKDRAKVTILPMSEFGVVQITRQRIRQNITFRLSDQCPLCGGTGRVYTKTTYITDIERWLQRYKTSGPNSFFLRLRVNPLIFNYLTSGFINKILRMCIKYRVIIKLEVDEKLPLSEFRFLTFKGKNDITEEYNT
jgi:ribonuclease G